MKLFRIFILSIAASSAFADVGIGGGRSLAGVEGVSVKVLANEDWLLEGILAAETNTGFTALSVCARGLHQFVGSEKLRTYLGVGLDYSNGSTYDVSSSQKLGYSSPTYTVNALGDTTAVTPGQKMGSPLALEFPLVVDYKVHPAFSFNTAVGVKVGLFSDKNSGLKANLFGSMGFTVWFNFGETKLGRDPKAE